MVLIRAFAILFILAEMIGCAAPKSLAIREPGSYQFKQELDGISVAVEPWTEPADLNELFSGNPSKPVVPIRVLIFNRGSSTARFSCTQMALSGPKGEIIPEVTPGEVADRLRASVTGLAVIVDIATLGYGAVVSQAMIESANQNNWNSKQTSRSQAMDAVIVDPGAVMTGFVFYDDSASKLLANDRPQNLTVTIQRMPRSQGDSLRFSIPFPSHVRSDHP